MFEILIQTINGADRPKMKSRELPPRYLIHPVTNKFDQAMSLWVLLVLLTVYFIHEFFVKDKRRRRMPPKVRGWPIINHTFKHLESEFPWQLVKWAKEYGEIFRTRSAATDFIWLSSPRAVKEIIDRRSAIYSSRQPQPMALGAASGGKRMTFMPKGKLWRTIRAILHRVHKFGFYD